MRALQTFKFKCEGNIKVKLRKKFDLKMWAGFIYLKMGILNGGVF